MDKPTKTAYLCPVCNGELLRVAEPWTDLIAAPAGALRHSMAVADVVAQMIHAPLAAYYADVDRALAVAVQDHRCPRRARWWLWRWKHRKVLAAA